MDDVNHEGVNSSQNSWFGLTLKKEIPLWGAIMFVFSMLLATYGLVKTFGKWEATLEAITDKVQIQQSELQFLRDLPSRMAKVEEKIEQYSKRQNEALDEIKALIVQTRPRNSAPSLQRRPSP